MDYLKVIDEDQAMRSIRLGLLGILTVFLLLNASAFSMAGDYNPRFVRNYPPGYHGMWYYAQRFQETDRVPDPLTTEKYRWDRFMSRITDLTFPYFPIPYAWDYGTDRTQPYARTDRSFGMPDYNNNDWR